MSAWDLGPTLDVDAGQFTDQPMINVFMVGLEPAV